jgi:hypothetical protein
MTKNFSRSLPLEISARCSASPMAATEPAR